jgi:4-hydroxy-tetrahydrodipicolinate reductase
MKVSLCGAGVVSANCAKVLAGRAGISVSGPFGRADRERALKSGADVVVIATSSFLSEVGPDIHMAVDAGSNVITSAEEGAFPDAVDPALARELDAAARARRVTILGTGLNPGFVFDAMVLTATGVAWEVDTIRVERAVELPGFSAAILRRLGIGFTPQEFADGIDRGAITGHIGFPQSMRIVARRLGVALERIEPRIEPIFGERDHEGVHLAVTAGTSAGFIQHYIGYADGRPWFFADFTAHMDLAAAGTSPHDEIWIDGPTPVHLAIQPGLNPQIGSAAVIVNSLRRVVEAPPGWLTVADLPPATPS